MQRCYRYGAERRHSSHTFLIRNTLTSGPAASLLIIICSSLDGSCDDAVRSLHSCDIYCTGRTTARIDDTQLKRSKIQIMHMQNMSVKIVCITFTFRISITRMRVMQWGVTAHEDTTDARASHNEQQHDTLCGIQDNILLVLM
jgi:hypothetical protein